MQLNRRQQRALRDFLLAADKLKYTPSDALARYLLDNYNDLLSWNGKELIFTVQSKQKFKHALHIHEPDLFHVGYAAQDRIGMAQVSRAEKFAPLAPEDSYVMVNQHQGDYACIGYGIALPLGISLRVPLERLRNTRLNKLVVVENLDVFDNWHRVNWADREMNTLAVYRGHEKSQSRGVSRLLELVASRVKIIAFCDYDPKGAEIALTTHHVQAMLVPDFTHIDTQLLFRINQPHLYEKQLRAVSFLRRSPYTVSHPQLQALCNEASVLAVLQQHLLAHDIELREMSLDKNGH